MTNALFLVINVLFPLISVSGASFDGPSERDEKPSANQFIKIHSQREGTFFCLYESMMESQVGIHHTHFFLSLLLYFL